jgi:hypothetical protein
LPLPPGTTDQGINQALDKLILPILEDFDPDLIINSAGQDNHYSDPLTNMNVTAQGYARLNDKLDPDIAILQGGYSIEGALPYINVGIILAMAGIDYSSIREPDYKEAITTQPAEITDQIDETIDYLLSKWKEAAALDKQEKFTGDYYQTEREVFYDTDQIREEQQIKIKNCSACSGLISIITQASPDKYGTSKVIIIPLAACSECKELGYEEYKRVSSAQLARIYLLDKPSSLLKQRKHP